MTSSGKTTLAIKLAKQTVSNGRNLLVLDPFLNPQWNNVGADVVTNDFAKFLHLAKNNLNCTLIIDEAGEYCDRHQKEAAWLATQSRHRGHKSIFITQHLKMVAPHIRGNCSKLFCFNVTPPNAKILYEEFGKAELLNAGTLHKGECFYVDRFEPVRKFNVFENNT